MTSPPTLPTPPSEVKDSRLGVVLRVAFFVATVYVAAKLLFILLYSVFGLVVAQSIGTVFTGLLANFLTMRIFDRRPLTDLGLHVGRASGVNYLIGLSLGGATAALILLAPMIAGVGHLVLREHSSFNWPTLITYLFSLWFAAAGEELIFHGYAFQLLVEKIGPFAAVLPVGVIFGVAHAINPGASLLAVVNTTLWGVLLGYAFLQSRDLWLPIGMHFGWNAVLPLFGVNLSGFTIEVTRYFYRWDLMPLWSGGDYGPEGGLLTTIFAAGLFYVLYRAPVRPQKAFIAQTLNEPEV